MIDNPALSIESTGANTRVLALIVDACFVTAAVRIKDAFRSAPGVWVTEIFGQA